MQQPEQKPWWQPAVTVFAEVTGWIAVPVIISLFLGKWLDERFGTEPWLFLGVTAIAVIITTVGIVRVATKYLKQIEREAAQRKKIIDDERNSKHNDGRRGDS